MNKKNEDIENVEGGLIKENEESKIDETPDKKKPLNKKMIIGGAICGVAIIVIACFACLGNKSNPNIVEEDDKILVDMEIEENGVKNEDRSFNDVLVSVSKDSFDAQIIKKLKGMEIGDTKSVTVDETLLKDGVNANDIPESAYSDGTASQYYESKEVKYTFTVKSIWKLSATVVKEDEDEDTRAEEVVPEPDTSTDEDTGTDSGTEE